MATAAVAQSNGDLSWGQWSDNVDAPFFAEEREGWKGYVEWEKCPEKKKKAAEIMQKNKAEGKFPDPPEFQLEPLPKTNPVLNGERFKSYHYAMGPTLENLPDISWKYVLKEKSPDMIHVLQFPYNGEPPRVSIRPGVLPAFSIGYSLSLLKDHVASSFHLRLLHSIFALFSLTPLRNRPFPSQAPLYKDRHGPNEAKPLTTSAPQKRLVSTPLTPNPDFFVRNHGGVPEIDASKFYLDIDGLVNKPCRLSLADLQNESLFPRKSMTVTLQCSGTRRIEQIAEYPGDGDELINAPWAEGAIGTARWTGVSLKSVLKHAAGGLRTAAGTDNHVELFGADTYFKKGQAFNYAVSVPWRKVKAHEVLLAWEMNGEPLPHIHGYPLRVVVAGYIGARSVKWLYRVRVIEGPSLAPVQQKEYLYYGAQTGKHNSEYSNGFSIQDMPVSSAVMVPNDKEVVLHEGRVGLKGWAYSGGGRWPIRVEVSLDGGNVWWQVPWEGLSEKFYHAWRTWSVELPCEAEGWLDVCVRCWDNALNTQPTFVRSAWNWDLHVTSSCHRIKIYSVNKTRPATAKRLKLLEEKGIPFTPITKPLEFDLESDEDYLANMKAQGGREPKE
ncbi:Oxidoreductase, molybdopterin-binding domain-containing protein [Macrophomina phaseolina]|uniref:Oxidoreductase, molybdopterin-binding domain-containing protein n=1 Tax=Macrophomina phaseolina TaxID=35725 RepID=A0ABQ8GG98_9PEZI|nr:Oxidoreductase, molybdopterin-binding domain-containing protein [Macrophomina phaseolina]